MAGNPKCDPLNNDFNIPVGPPLPGVPGYSFDINFPTIPLPNLAGIPEDILNWVRRLKFNLPGSGLLQKFVDALSNTIAQILSGLLAGLNVFMGFYFFILAIIELLLCIIKVLCALPNPFAVIRAVIRMFRRCIPLFISICFPFFAFLLLLLALIAILIALIEYIIMMIIRLIKQLIKNILRLYNLLAHQRAPNAALAVVAKLSNMLCLFEMIFEFLAVIFALLDLILGGLTSILKICDNGDPNPDGSRGPDNDLICAEFMANPIEQTDPNVQIYKSRVGGSSGVVLYCNQVFGNQHPLFPSPTITSVREETIYLQDDLLAQTLKFSNIISDAEGFSFFPFDKVITKDINKRLKPYFIDLYINYDPSDGYGLRKINLTDITVVNVSTTATTSVVASVPHHTTDANGYLLLSGGSVVNDPVQNGKTIEQLIGQAATFDNGGNDPYFGIEYYLKINYEALMQYMLITAGCMPNLIQEQQILNAAFAKAFNFTLPDFVTFPDVGGAIAKLQNCMSNYRANITLETTTSFGECMLATMAVLGDQASTTYCQLLQTALDPFNVDLSMTPDLQFVNKAIQVKASPLDQANRTFTDLIGGFTPPPGCLKNLADLFKGQVTLGEISGFSYDGYGNFLANITSQHAGDGYLSVYFDGNIVKKTTRPADPSTPAVITDYVLPYTFIGFTADGYQPVPRRDETDVANGGR